MASPPWPLTLQTIVLPTVPLASVLIRCGYFFFLTLRLNFSSSAECLLSFMLFFLLQIPILFYWLSFADGPPISSFLCLWFYEHVCICSDVFVFPCQQILLVFFFFLLNNFCLPTLISEASEIECLDGTQIPAIYCLLILDTSSLQRQLRPCPAPLIPPGWESWGWWALLVASGFQYKSSRFISLQRPGYLKTRSVKNSSHHNSYLGSFQESSAKKQLDSTSQSQSNGRRVFISVEKSWQWYQKTIVVKKENV